MRVKFQSDLFVPQFSLIERGDFIGIVGAINIRNYEIFSSGANKIVFKRFEPRVNLNISVVSPSIRPLSRIEREFKNVVVDHLKRLGDRYM